MFKKKATLGSAPEPVPQPRPPAAAPEALADDGPISILIVDDEPKNLTVLETVLNDPAYRLVRAESGEQALLALVAGEFALLILDIRMPGMTGFDLAKMIKERKKTARVPIIFLTAYYNEDQHVLEGYGTGAVDYLHKPVNPTVLRSKVAVFADLHRKARELESANHALQGEVGERRRAEERLHELNTTLEQRVAERTESLRASEARMRLAQDAAGIGVFDRDLDTGVNTWTPELVAMHGLPPGGFSHTVAEWERLVHPEDREGALRLVRHALETGLPVEGEWRVVWPDGSVHWVLARFQAVREAGGRPLRLTGVNIDITARKVAEEAMRESERRKDEFLAVLAHELRNPLAPVRNAVQVLHMKGPSTPEVQWAKTIIDRQMQAMTRLIEDLMDVSRISRGKIELRREPLDLARVIQDAVDSSRPIIEQHGHELTVSLPTEAVSLAGDPTRLTQVFLNLLNNAAKFTERGGRISLAAEAADGGVTVTVRDTGLGIPAANLSTIFDMFSQVESTMSRSRGGLGIGLCLVKRIVELHGGRVEASSPGLNQGSEFRVRLPTAGPGPVARSSGVDDQDQPTPSSRLRILVADDNEDAATSLKVLLGAMGNTVYVAHDGQEAVDLADRHRPEVVLLDIGMPKMNGYEAARAIREKPWGRHTILIAVTGWGQEEDKRKSREAGFDRHLVKPVAPLALMQLLAETRQNKP